MKTTITKQFVVIICLLILLVPCAKVFGQVQATMVIKAEKRARKLNKQIGKGKSKSVYKQRFTLPSFSKKGPRKSSYSRKYRTSQKPLKSTYKPNYKTGGGGYVTPKSSYSSKRVANFKVPFKPAHRTFDNITPFVYQGDRKVYKRDVKDHRAMRLAANFGMKTQKRISGKKLSRQMRSPSKLKRLISKNPYPYGGVQFKRPKSSHRQTQKKIANFTVPSKAPKYSKVSKKVARYKTNLKPHRSQLDLIGPFVYEGNFKIDKRGPKGVRAEKVKGNPTTNLEGRSFLGLNIKRKRTAGAVMRYSYNINSFNKYAFGNKRKSLLAYKPSSSKLNKSQGNFKGTMANARYRRKYKSYDELYEYWGKQISLTMLRVTPNTSFKHRSTSKKGGKNHKPAYLKERVHLKYDSREAEVWY